MDETRIKHLMADTFDNEMCKSEKNDKNNALPVLSL
jgi:hypothetical protein